MKLFNNLLSLPLRYCFNYFIYYGMITIVSVTSIPLLIVTCKHPRIIAATVSFCRPTSWLIGIRWGLRGKEHLIKNRACILISNHQTSFDIVGLFHLAPILGKATGVAKSSLFYAWPFGLLIWLCGIVFIDRSNSDKAKAILNKTLQEVKKNKVKLHMFPEGTRRNDGKIHDFKKGAFYIAVVGQLPIVPVVFSRYYFLSDEEKRFDPGEVIMTALPAIPTEGLTVDDIPDLIKRTRDQMIEVFNYINEEKNLRSYAQLMTTTLTELPPEPPIKSKM